MKLSKLLPYNLRWYGIAYYLSKNYRRLVQYEKNRRARDKYGTAFLNRKNIIRRKLLHQYKYKCAMCQCTEKSRPLTIDHIIPVSEGGTNLMKNLRILCITCHKKVTEKNNAMRYNPTRTEWIKQGLLIPAEKRNETDLLSPPTT